VPLSEYISILVLLVLTRGIFRNLYPVHTPLVNYVNQTRFLLCLIVVALIEPFHMTANCQQVAP